MNSKVDRYGQKYDHNGFKLNFINEFIGKICADFFN